MKHAMFFTGCSDKKLIFEFVMCSKRYNLEIDTFSFTCKQFKQGMIYSASMSGFYTFDGINKNINFNYHLLCR